MENFKIDTCKALLSKLDVLINTEIDKFGVDGLGRGTDRLKVLNKRLQIVMIQLTKQQMLMNQ